jgi:hypothetical protein
MRHSNGFDVDIFLTAISADRLVGIIFASVIEKAVAGEIVINADQGRAFALWMSSSKAASDIPARRKRLYSGWRLSTLPKSKSRLSQLR